MLPGIVQEKGMATRLESENSNVFNKCVQFQHGFWTLMVIELRNNCLITFYLIEFRIFRWVGWFGGGSLSEWCRV